MWRPFIYMSVDNPSQHVDSKYIWSVQVRSLYGFTTPPPFLNFLLTYLFSIKFLYFFIISSLFPYFNLFVSIFIQSYVRATSACDYKGFVCFIYTYRLLCITLFDDFNLIISIVIVYVHHFIHIWVVDEDNHSNIQQCYLRKFVQVLSAILSGWVTKIVFK
jgi:hypothetical protein